MEEKIEITPIGYVMSEYDDSYYHADKEGKRNYSEAKIKMLPEYKIGIKDLKVGMIITIIFHFNKSSDYDMVSPTCFSKEPLGIFSSRSPRRPNGLGITATKIVAIDDDSITIEKGDMIDGTPIIDIKPGK
ncbi:MAG: TrmO family methyltransferase domain-containing protein [Sphaerochaeta sp.]